MLRDFIDSVAIERDMSLDLRNSRIRVFIRPGGIDGLCDATYVLDGLLYHESDLRIEEHYTAPAGFIDHVFALMHLLGFRFAPRIRALTD